MFKISYFAKKSFLTWDSFRLKKLEETYTNYGCYCWIDGIDQGVIGGGATKDATDHHCKELYRCYKCVNVDYMKNYTDVSYTGMDSFWEFQLKCQKHKNLNWDCDLGQRFSSKSTNTWASRLEVFSSSSIKSFTVDFTSTNSGARDLDCSVNSKQDAENICECDRRFAQNIAETITTCEAEPQSSDPENGDFCMDEKFRTVNGEGKFDPRTQCEKQFHGHDKVTYLDHLDVFYVFVSVKRLKIKFKN